VSVDPQIIACLRAWAETKPEVRSLWTFGSRARGDHRDASDLDLAFDANVALELREGFFDRIAHGQWKAEIAARIPFEPDLWSIGNTLPNRPGEYVRDAVKRDGGVLVYSVYPEPEAWASLDRF
jgi:hypothetical protein